MTCWSLPTFIAGITVGTFVLWRLNGRNWRTIDGTYVIGRHASLAHAERADGAAPQEATVWLDVEQVALLKGAHPKPMKRALLILRIYMST